MRTLTCVSFIFLAAICASAQCRDVRFGKGHFSTTISGATAKQNTCYRIRAKTSQLITLHLDATDPKTTFSLSEDYYDADFTADSVRDWQGHTGNVDAYMIMVGGGKRGTPYKLTVSIK